MPFFITLLAAYHRCTGNHDARAHRSRRIVCPSGVAVVALTTILPVC